MRYSTVQIARTIRYSTVQIARTEPIGTVHVARTGRDRTAWKSPMRMSDHFDYIKSRSRKTETEFEDQF